MTPARRPSAPSHLSTPMKAWWRQVVDDYSLEPHHLLLLTQACEAHDRATQARKQVDADGPTIADRFGQLRPHPAVQIERDSRAAFARLVRQLDLEGEGDPLYRRSN